MKINTKTVHKVEYNEFDKALSEFLKSKEAKDSDFEVVCHHELSNDSSQKFSVAQYDWQKLEDSDKEEILGGKLDFRGQDILNWMHEEGLVPAGEYIVDICW